MSTETEHTTSEKRKKLLKQDFKEGLKGIQEIFVGTIALIITAAESISKSDKINSLIKFSSGRKKTDPKQTLSIIKQQKQTSNNDPVDVSIEIDKTQTKEMNKLINVFIYPLLATISTIAFVSGIIRINPLIKWAETQNECIEKTVSINGINSVSLPNKVMSCNGGHSF